ncbi:hypothetical protein HY500_01810 [Candidatus Woesearchaeota archaeon]|nr:hypothetical protein [Candidatus Woesearchaeota archaeon]
MNKASKKENNICERCGKDGCKCSMAFEAGTGILLVILGGLLWFGVFSLPIVFGAVLVLWGIKKLLGCRK